MVMTQNKTSWHRQADGSHWLAYSTQHHRTPWQENMEAQQALPSHLQELGYHLRRFLKRPSPRFHQEIDNLSISIFKMLVEDKISDDQFEKLLKRRDDLLERANTQPPSPTPKT
jgi:hypothetical protein